MKMKTLAHLASSLKAIALLAFITLTSTMANAADRYWSGTPPTLGGVGTWNTSSSSTNWGTTVVGPFLAWTNANNDTAVFNGTGATVTLTDNITVGGLTFNKVNGVNTYYTLNTAANTLSFASGDNAINLNIGNGGAPTATIIGQVGGSGANVIIAPQSTVASGGGTGFGTVIFNGASAGGWDGGTTINAAGTLSTVSTAALTNRVLANTSSITLNGGTIQFTRASNANIDAISSSAIGVNGGGTFSVTSSSGGASAIEDIGTVTVNSGQMNFVQTANNANELVLGGLSRGATTGITFSSPTSFGTARWKVSGAGTTSGWVNADPSNSIIGSWATIGTTLALQTDYAVYNGDYVTPANTTATAETTWGDATKQYTLSYATKTATALTATRNIAALKASTPSASVSTAVMSGSPTFTVASGHSFAVNDPVVILTAPGGFVPGRVYYVQSVGGGGTTFTLSATPGGAAITATSNVTAIFAGGIKLDSGITLGTMGILNSGTALAIGRTLAGSGSISLPTAGAGNLFINAGSGNIGIDVPIVNNGGALTLVKTGNSILHLSNNNTFTGGIVVNAGTVRLSGTQSFTGGVTLSGGAFGDSTDGISAAEINNNSVTVNGNASMYITSGETLAGAIAINSTGNLKLNGATATLGGVVSGSGVLTITGTTSPTVTLSNTANTHTGVISIVSDNNGNAHLGVNSLADSASPGAGNIQMGGGGTLGSYLFALHSGAIAPLILNNRQVELVGDGPSAAYPFKLANNSTQAFTINSNLRASGSNIKTLTLGGTGSGLSTFGGIIGNGGHTTLNLTKADANNTWVLTNGANSYSGATTISGGTLQISTLANAGVNSPIGAYPTAGAGGLSLGGGTLLYTGGSVTTDRGFTLTGNSTLNLSGSGVTLALGDCGAGSGTSAALTVSGTSGNTLTIGNVNTISSASNPWSIDPASGLSVSINGVMSGTGGFCRRGGAGPLTLNNTGNTFTGDVVVNNGNSGRGPLLALNVANYGVASALGKGTAGTGKIVLGGNGGDFSVLTFTGTGSTSDRQFSLDATSFLNNNGSGALNFTGYAGDSYKFIIGTAASAGTRTLTLGGTYTASANVISGNITNSNASALVAITKGNDNSTWTLSGANTYSGATTVNGGTLALDYTTVASKLADGAALVLGGGTLDLKNGASSHTEVVSATTLTAGTASSVTRSSGTSVLRMNAITFGAGATITFGAGSIASTSQANVSGILNPGATIGGVDWAINSGTLEGSGNNFITAYTGYTDVTRLSSGTKAIANGTTTNVRIIDGTGGTGDNTVTGTIAINTLNQSATGGASTIAMANQTLRANGILMGPSAGALTIGAAGGTALLSGTLTQTTGNNGSLSFINHSASDMVINSVIAMNGTPNTFIKSGTGTLVLAGNNTFSGGFTIQDGTIKAGATGSIFGSGGNFTIANKSTATLDLNGYNGTVNQLVGGGALGGNVSLGSKTLTIGNPSGSYDGIISGTGGSMKLGGATTMTLTRANTYTGATTLEATTGLFVSILANGGIASGIGQSTSDAGNLVFNGSGTIPSLRYTSTVNATTDRQFTLKGNGGFAIYSSGALTLSSTAAIAHGANVVAKTLLLAGNGTGGGILAALITDSGTGVNVTGINLGFSNSANSGANWSLTNPNNTFSGPIVHTSAGYAGGTFSYASAGGTNAITFNQTTSTATLSYIGAGQTMSGPIKAIALTTGTITLDASGTGAINYSNTGSMGVAASGNKNLILSGSNTGNNTLAASWDNNTGGAATLSKNGAGTWALSGTNTFSGATTVNGGTLVLAANQCSGTTTVNGGKLVLAASTCLSDTNRLTIATGAKVKLNAGVREIVGYLTTNGTQAVSGTYGSSASAAAIKNDLFFDVAGTGVLYVGVPISPDGTLIQFF